jgi:hypothetical protein
MKLQGDQAGKMSGSGVTVHRQPKRVCTELISRRQEQVWNGQRLPAQNDPSRDLGTS